MKFWNSGEVLVILIYFQQNLMKKITDNFKKNWVKLRKKQENLIKNQEKLKSLKFTNKSCPRKIQGKFIQIKKGPLQIQKYFQGNEDDKNIQEEMEEEKNWKIIPIFSSGPRHMGEKFWRGSASYLGFHILRRFVTIYFLFFGAVRVLFTFHFFSSTSPYLIFFLCSSITQYLLRNFIHFFFHNSIVTKR